ncbi:SDR family NAD(P)-dependent oxidoreductase [Roseibium polysiphoniae]|uniref:SDR family NAD(P)-dependent oxidoreductase n=1 Tax=Roseibium polysiphoniae TaxID=2571221 RepID=A0A944CBB6_9HYPH|nr:SDR family NAD(P)-dependent oxidoreductase [Roseibium polysiphoniae]MBS8259324.1 SDR family NAD(P)-dependent oxidoreductase [Roseibium polysiphoniae]
MTKTILITGATDGIGLLTAEVLAAEGHLILLHGRNAAKLEQAQNKVGGRSEIYLADMSRLADVNRLADEILAKHDHIDVVINNAGVYKTPAHQTDQGFDTRFVVNTIAPYVLTRRLLSVMSPESRVVNLSSAAQAPVDVAALQGQKRLSDMEAYAQSKLAITIWTRELAKEMSEGPVFIAVNPGSLLASKMVREGFGMAGNDLGIGADILSKAALSPDFAQASGKYFDNDSGRFANPEQSAMKDKTAASVMAAIEELTSKVA